MSYDKFIRYRQNKSSMSNCFVLINNVRIRRDVTIARESRETNRALPTHRNRTDMGRERDGGQTRKAVEEVYGWHNPRVLWRAAIVPLLDYGRKENTRLIVRGSASPGNTIRSLADRLYDYIVINWQWSEFPSGCRPSGNFLTNRYNDRALRLSFLVCLRFFAYQFFADQSSGNLIG